MDNQRESKIRLTPKEFTSLKAKDKIYFEEGQKDTIVFSRDEFIKMSMNHIRSIFNEYLINFKVVRKKKT